MKWKFFISMVGLTLALAIVNKMIMEIPLLIIFVPLLIGSIVISVASIIQIGIVVGVWILLYVLVLGKEIF